jgi:hypothetical protein
MSALEHNRSEDDAPPVDAISDLDRVIRGVVFWSTAFTFVWGFVVIIALKKLRWYQGSFLAFAYPIVCILAAICLLRSSRGSRFAFAGANFISAVAWSAFVYWVAVQFARHFWK